MDTERLESNVLKLKAYKENESWYIDDDNGFSREQNQLVAGVPEFIELFSASDRVFIDVSTNPFPGAFELTLSGSDDSGTDYESVIDGKTYSIWLCSVFFYYFPVAPEVLYFKIE